MNAFVASPGGAYAEGHARCAAPATDADFISIGIDGKRFRVFYARGRAFWVARELRDGAALPGVPLADCVPDCLHAQAARLADSFLMGVSRGVAAQIADHAPPAGPFSACAPLTQLLPALRRQGQ